MKKTSILFPLVLFGASLSFEGCNRCVPEKKPSPYPEYPQEMQQRQMPFFRYEYDTLTLREQNFAAKLNATNRKIFCEQFTPAQRNLAINLKTTQVCPRDKNCARRTYKTANLTPDEAVEWVAKGTRMKG